MRLKSEGDIMIDRIINNKRNIERHAGDGIVPYCSDSSGGDDKAIAKKTKNVFTFKERLDILTGEDTTTVVSPNTVKGWDIFQVRAAVNLHYGRNVQLVSAISFS